MLQKAKAVNVGM